MNMSHRGVGQLQDTTAQATRLDGQDLLRR